MESAIRPIEDLGNECPFIAEFKKVESYSMSNPSTPPTGNPVFDYKAHFRTTAQSIQRILLYNGVLIAVIGLAAHFIALKNPELRVTFQIAPWLGLASILLSGIWGFEWRSKLRSDFQREYAPK